MKKERKKRKKGGVSTQVERAETSAAVYAVSTQVYLQEKVTGPHSIASSGKNCLTYNRKPILAGGLLVAVFLCNIQNKEVCFGVFSLPIHLDFFMLFVIIAFNIKGL